MDRCLDLLEERKETHFDILLATQIKCQHITNQLNQALIDPSLGQAPEPPSTILVNALSRQLDRITQSVSSEMKSQSKSRP